MSATANNGRSEAAPPTGAGGAPSPEFLPDLLNCKVEDDPVVTNLAIKEGVALIAFIAPYVSVRVSPVEEARAVIGLMEEFGVEKLVNQLREDRVEKAYLLVNSPGGLMDSSYKIARAIRTTLREVTTFVPHVAASGGTLLALAGDEIVMGPMSHLTPLDPQVVYKGARISAGSGVRFYSRSVQWFEKQTPDEAPYPQRAMTDKLDPFLMEEWNGSMDAMVDYVRELLELSNHPDAANVAWRLVWGYPTHGYVLNAQRGRDDIGLNITDSTSRPETWEVMRHWLGQYLVKPEMSHCIRYVLPTRQAKKASNGAKRRTSTTQQQKQEGPARAPQKRSSARRE